MKIFYLDICIWVFSLVFDRDTKKRKNALYSIFSPNNFRLFCVNMSIQSTVHRKHKHLCLQYSNRIFKTY